MSSCLKVLGLVVVRCACVARNVVTPFSKECASPIATSKIFDCNFMSHSYSIKRMFVVIACGQPNLTRHSSFAIEDMQITNKPNLLL